MKRGSLGEQKGVREDQEEKGIGRAGHLFLRASLTPFFHGLCPSFLLSISLSSL